MNILTRITYPNGVQHGRHIVCDLSKVIVAANFITISIVSAEFLCISTADLKDSAVKMIDEGNLLL